LNIFDVIIIVLLLIGAYSGYRKGLILEILAFLAFIIAIIGGFYLMHLGMDLLTNYFNLSGKSLPLISFILIFIAIILSVNFIGRMLKKVIDMTILGSIDNLTGALIGILKWAFGISILLWLSSAIGFQSTAFMKESKLIPYIEPIGPKVIDYISILIPYVHQIFEAIQEMLEKR
jgi:membrane protein required for colicin V production